MTITPLHQQTRLGRTNINEVINNPEVLDGALLSAQSLSTNDSSLVISSPGRLFKYVDEVVLLRYKFEKVYFLKL